MERIGWLMLHAPRTNEWVSGTKLVLQDCCADRLVFKGEWQHCRPDGRALGVTRHRILIVPSIYNGGRHIIVEGKDTGGAKDHIKEFMRDWLNEPVSLPSHLGTL